MKVLSAVISVILVVGIMFSLYLTAEKNVVEAVIEDGKSHQLTVTLNQVNSDYKMVYLYVYDETEQRVFTKTLTPQEALQPVVFKGVESGRYAVRVHQNRDDDPNLSLNGMGIPLEPLGFSNNPVLMGPPPFTDVSIGINQDTEVSINLITYG